MEKIVNCVCHVYHEVSFHAVWSVTRAASRCEFDASFGILVGQNNMYFFSIPNFNRKSGGLIRVTWFLNNEWHLLQKSLIKLKINLH